MHVITFPETFPRAGDLRSGGRFMLGLARLQPGLLGLNGLVALGWMLGQAAVPVLLGRTIDAGVLGHDGTALLIGCLAMLAAGLATALVGTLAHRISVNSWLRAALGTQRITGHHVADHGIALSASTTTGELVETAGSDAHRIGELFESSGRGLAAVVTYPVVVAVVVHLDLAAGLWLAIGLPVMTALLALLVRPLQSRERDQREALGQLSALGSDTAAGLRVLRGIGGERQFVHRYREGSQVVRRKGVQVARAWAPVEMAQVGLPSVFIVVLIWLGAQGVMSGRLTGGELITLYGSGAYLKLPLDVAAETLFNIVAARVAAERVVAVLRTRERSGPAAAGPSDPAGPAPAGPGDPAAPADRDVATPPLRSELVDPESGVRLAPGALTALVSAIPEQANTIADRMAGLAPGDVRLGGVPINRLPKPVMRQRIQLGEAEPRLFSGTLREQIDPDRGHPDDAILRALAAADAIDVLDGLPEGLDSVLEERGRGLSGGQRQRLALARALLADAEVLLLVEPTSAVDAHTEVRVANRLSRARQGRTTLVTTASPLLLRACDRVLFLIAGQVSDQGTHRELMSHNAAYRRVVTRDLSGEEDER